MDGSMHRRFAASASLAVSAASGTPAWQTAAAAVIATATPAGWTSPDADQSWLNWLPGGHRGLLHWWGLPALPAYAGLGFNSGGATERILRWGGRSCWAGRSGSITVARRGL
jgi:hypothetical protein